MDMLQFEERYPPQPPRREPSNPGELRCLAHKDGVVLVRQPPVETQARISPRREGWSTGRHLWVFVHSQIPCILESAPSVAPPLESGVAKHTNLTGGGLASCGGELWIDPVEDDRLYVNGASGRYGPRTPQELSDAVAVFAGLGFEIESFGWDDDVDLPARVLR